MPSTAPAPAPSPSPAAPTRSSNDLFLGLALLAVAAAGIAWFARRDPEPLARPAASDVLLEGTFSLGNGPFSQRIRVNEPARLEIRIDPRPGDALEAWFGPPGPVEASPVDTPDPARAVHWNVKAGDAPRVEAVLAYGLYVLRVARAPGADSLLLPGPASARVVVRALPVR